MAEYTMAELAEMWGTDQKTIRRFMRSKFDRVGRGGRWAVDAAAADALHDAFKKRGSSVKRTITINDLT